MDQVFKLMPLKIERIVLITYRRYINKFVVSDVVIQSWVNCVLSGPLNFTRKMMFIKIYTCYLKKIVLIKNFDSWIMTVFNIFFNTQTIKVSSKFDDHS